LKSIFSLTAFALIIQACGSQPLINEQSVQANIGGVEPIKNQVFEIDSSLSLAAAADPVNSSVAKSEPAGADIARVLAGVKISSALAVPTSVRVSFELVPEKEEKDAALKEKIIIEKNFPSDIEKSEIAESKSKLKLRHDRSYKVLVEQLKEGKVLQTTSLDLKFKHKRGETLKLATSQKSGVTLRYGKKDDEVMRECPAGQFMSGIGFKDIPICRAVESSSAASAPLMPNVVSPDLEIQKSSPVIAATNTSHDAKCSDAKCAEAKCSEAMKSIAASK
jgi:hypothetical protein